MVFLTQSVFLGLFYGALDVAAYALFLDVYPASMLPKAYIISGIFGILLTSLYTRLQSRTDFSRFALFNLVTIAFLALLLRMGFLVFSKSIIVWIIFVLYTPLNIVATLGFWGAVGRTFTLRQGKRIFGLIDSGQILGIILSSYGVTALLSLKVQTKDLLFISSISIVAALLLQFVISRRLKKTLSAEPAIATAEPLTEEAPVHNNFFSFLKTKYIFYLASFAGFSMVATFFVHYCFVTAAKDNYPDTTNFAKFIGAFTGTMMIFSLLIKTFVYGRMMKTYGLRTILLLSPMLLALFAIAGLLLGSLMGYTSTSGNFMLFFLIMSLTKLFSKTLKDSFEVPSFKILYQSISSRIRFSVQSRIDGTVNEMSALASGLMLAGLASLSFIKIIHFVAVLLVVLLVWIYIAMRLYREYRNSLQSSLASYEKKLEHKHSADPNLLMQEGMAANAPAARLFSLELARKMNFSLFENAYSRFMANPDETFSRYARSTFASLPPSTLQKLLKETHASDRFELPYIPPDWNEASGFDQMERLVKSPNPLERAWGAYRLSGNNSMEKLRLLKLLLRDPDPRVKRAAMTTCSADRLTELAPSLIEHLSHPECFDTAFESLRQMGDSITDLLEIYFAKSGTDENAQLRIIMLYATMPGKAVKNLLFNKMESFNRRISLEAIQSLKKLRITFSEADTRLIFRVMNDYMSRMAWATSLQISLLENRKFARLQAALEAEVRRNYEVIMELLALAYDDRSVMLIKENLDAGTREGAGYALELMDIFIADELKRFIFPLFEDNAPAEKLRVMQEEYPVSRLSPEKVVKSILNRSRNEISDYTKLVALLAYADLGEQDISHDLSAHLFNPDLNIAETAAWMIRSIRPTALDELIPRVEDAYRDELLNRISTFSNDKGLQNLFPGFLLFLSEHEGFKGLTGEQLKDFAAVMQRHTLEVGESMPLNGQDSSHFMFIVVYGSVSLLENKVELGHFVAGDVVVTASLDLIPGPDTEVTASEQSLIAILDKQQADALLFNQPEYCELFYKFVQNINPLRQTA